MVRCGKEKDVDHILKHFWPHFHNTQKALHHCVLPFVSFGNKCCTVEFFPLTPGDRILKH